MPIRRLTEPVTLKIAAGEVIDRPASVVKELVENAIDARSERIDVVLREGGKSLVTVRDDGEGMLGEDLGLAFERYATSKIQTEDDLYSIETLGFRGEALASIAAVSRARITSCSREGDGAHVLEVSGGAVGDVTPAGRPPGTTIEVQDLFFNVPARARFLGSPRTEFMHANRVVQRLALLSPVIGWTVTHEDREVFAAPAVTSLHDRLAQIYGTDVANGMIPIDAARGGITVRGFISRPDLKRGNRRDQSFIVNGRFVSDRGLSFVLASAYRGILRPGSYPIAVIHIDLPHEQVDVNVHPRKEEIRFADARQVQDTVAAALQKALSSSQVVAPVASSRGTDERATVAAESRTRYATERTEALSFDLPREIRLSGRLRETEKVRVTGDRRVIGQLQSTYLLVETPEGLEIVDQHIAHERVLYEGLRDEWNSEGVVRQIFLIPARVEVPFETASVITGHLEELERVGIILDEFGGGTFLIREYPRALADEQTKRGFQEVVEALVQALSDAGSLEEPLFDRLLRELACGAAIKAGEPMPLAAAQSLVEELMTLENPYFCPHGRPIVFSLGREELDRRFQRR
jgi:DNA mismatch repair protein MutL